MTSLTVWACGGLPPSSLNDVILWQSFLPDDAPPSWISLPGLVQQNKNQLRDRYRRWLASVALYERADTSIVKQMTIRPHFSYWWMTLPTDNSLAVNSPSFDIARLFALADAVVKNDMDSIRIIGERKYVVQALESWALRLGVDVTVETIAAPTLPARGRFANRLPFLRATRVFWDHLQQLFLPNKKSSYTPRGGGVTFIDYLAHVAEPHPGEVYRSAYWGKLVEVLDSWPEPITWLHLPATYATRAVASHHLSQVKILNSSNPSHSLVHSAMTLTVLLAAWRDYLKIRRFGRTLIEQPTSLNENTSLLDLSPLVVETIRDQYFGRSAALNALWINLWERTFRDWPKQRLGVYVFENQPWELAMLSAWRHEGHGKIIAYGHTSMVFWDLRYFGTFADSPHHTPEIMQPDLIGVNGPLMLRAAQSAGYDPSSLTSLEALRFQPPGPGSAPVGRPHFALILGDYSTEATEELLRMCATAEESSNNWRFEFRPHPARSQNNVRSPFPTDADVSLSSHILACSAVIAGPHTSATLEALLLGRPTAALTTPNTFAGNPADGLPGFCAVAGPQDISAFLDRVSSQTSELSQSIFFPLGDLQAWRHLLERPG